MSAHYCAPRFVNGLRTHKLKLTDCVVLKTKDERVDLLYKWAYRRQLLDLASLIDKFVYPRNVAIFLRSDSFRAFAFDSEVVVSIPTTEKRVSVLIHESVHLALHSRRPDIPSHRMEFEACSIQDIYRPAGVHASRLYVRQKIARALDGGAKVIDRAAAEYSGIFNLPEFAPRVRELLGDTPNGESYERLRAEIEVLVARWNGIVSPRKYRQLELVSMEAIA